MYRARTPVYRAYDREGERVAIASLCSAAPRRSPIGVSATSTKRLSPFDACRPRALRISRCHVCRSASHSFVVHARVYTEIFLCANKTDVILASARITNSENLQVPWVPRFGIENRKRTEL